MSVTQSTAYCNVCQKQSLYQKPRINHVLHLILTLVTIGLWGFVWLTLGLINSAKPARCVHCGSEKGAGAVYAPPPAAQLEEQPAPPEAQSSPPTPLPPEAPR